MSQRIRYSVPRTIVGGFSDTALVFDGELPEDVITESILTEIGTRIDVTIGEVTMHLSAWRDPAHWAEDWEAKIGVDADDVPEAVAKLLADPSTPSPRGGGAA